METLYKCVIWDLDNTLWNGICLEGRVEPRDEVRRTLEVLRDRGVLHSIASRGDEAVARQTLESYDLRKYFVEPKINWLPKNTNILDIARTLNISLDAVAFVDDDPFEREQISYMLPAVRVIEAGEAAALPDLDGFNPGVLTAEARTRTRLYEEEQGRQSAAASYTSREDFLLSCRMQLDLRPATAGDAPRVMELMQRTHQMNSTGLLLSESALLGIIRDSEEGPHLYVAELSDRFGWCGIIGVFLAEVDGPQWQVALFAMSCRVMGRGIERAIISELVDRATARGCRHFRALYHATERNRMMRTMFQMSGFRQQGMRDNGSTFFELDFTQKPTRPSWVSVI
ncbi:MAG: HAD-IIIC family phosphatase [Bacteroidetes bacterium]|nr:HAD-IIIC family phosphatase [Bacteroidota bacterium]